MLPNILIHKMQGHEFPQARYNIQRSQLAAEYIIFESVEMLLNIIVNNIERHSPIT